MVYVVIYAGGGGGVMVKHPAPPLGPPYVINTP